MRRDRRAGGAGFRFFADPADPADPADAPRARRATDVLLVLATSMGLLLVGSASVPPAAVEAALIDLLAALPGFLDGLWQLLYDLVVPWALALVVVALVRRRGALARDQALATVVALAVGVVAGHLVDGSWPGMWSVLTAHEPPPHFPPLRIAAASACIATGSPYLSHPVHRVGRWIVTLGATSVALLGAATPTGALAGVLTGVFAAAAVHLVFGSCGGRPGLGDVRAALADLGVPVASLGVADRQPAGAFLVRGIGCDGRDLTVKVYGRDAYGTQLLVKLWRTVWYRDEGPAPTLSRVQQAEHEAFLTLLAHHGDVPVQEVVTAGVTDEDDALLVLRLRGVPLGDVPAEEVTDDVLHGVWATLRLLHRRSVAHGQIDPDHLWVDDGVVTLVDLGGATVAPRDDQRRIDEAQALVTSVLVAGVERGLAAGHAALCAEGLAEVVPYLQMPALPRSLRPQVRRAGIDVDDLRRRAAGAAGVPPTDLQQLRRVTWGTVLQTGLPILAFLALLSGLAGLDLEDIAAQMRDADWWWVAFGALLVQTPRVAQAVSTLGASPRPTMVHMTVDETAAAGQAVQMGPRRNPDRPGPSEGRRSGATVTAAARARSSASIVRAGGDLGPPIDDRSALSATCCDRDAGPMFFHRFRRRPGRSGRALRPAEPPANPSPRPHAGELGRSELADETEAFLHGSLAELRAANDRPLDAWMLLNRICHGDAVDIFGMAAREHRGPLLSGVSSAYHHVWSTAQCSIATRLLERALDPGEIRQVQHDVLVPLELRLITLSRDEPVTFAAVTAAALSALDHLHLDR